MRVSITSLMHDRIGSLLVESVEPEIDAGRHPAKRILGEQVQVRADILKEGHDLLRAVVRWRQVRPTPLPANGWKEAPMHLLGNDRWQGNFLLPRLGRYVFTIEAWPDVFATWCSELERRIAAGQEIRSELIEGAALLQEVASRAGSDRLDAERLRRAAEELPRQSAAEALLVVRDPELLELSSKYPDRSSAGRYDRELEIIADRPRAMAGSWYELFPRSCSPVPGRHGTFQDCEAVLPDIQNLGFDVLYLPPIHPIGSTGRKGRENAPRARPEDVGSPWAIGAAEGGHKSVHPELGTLEDFKRFVRVASERGIEVALDLAFQCSPDHPYIREHPEWFSWRPDGTLKTAENPPKRYQDIVNFDFTGPARESLWQELKSIVLFWIDVGVKIFRVDNPHTKPLPFWAWLIPEVQNQHPDVIFLAEAFTRPKMMNALAKVGFTQSYTYFTWRNFKHELEEYFRELTQGPEAEYMRGNLWPATPDILPEFLQQGGKAAFKIRLFLAGTLLPSYGIYSGYEFCESAGIPGTEEFQNSEKYQLVHRDPRAPENIRSEIRALNAIRRSNPALQLYRNLTFHRADNDRVLFYSKITPNRANQLLIAVSLDPHAMQRTILEVPLQQLGIGHEETYQVHELLTDRRTLWQGPRSEISLTPEQPAAIWSVLRFARRENSFDYFY